MNKINFFSILLLCIFSLNGADWTTLQGTQKKAGHKVWGFLQIKGEYNSGDTIIDNGINKTSFSYIKPNLVNQSEVQVGRARFGLRGSVDDENKINYFLLTELAENGVNNPLGYHYDTYLTDASVTIKYFPLYIRVGKFKYSGSEEGLMARFVSPFINFTNVTNQFLLERHIYNPDSNGLYKPSQGVGAFRDTGIQLFQRYPLDDKSNITVSYMIGNGSGTANYNVNNNNYTNYGFLAYEKKLGKGKGYNQESFKLYTWYQEGKRLLRVSSQNELYNRTRYGLGFTYYHNRLRIESEYIAGSGMIVTGAKDSDSKVSRDEWKYSIAASSDNLADGYYLSTIYEPFKNIEVMAKYDVYNRETNKKSVYRKFETITTGLSYRFKNYDRIDLNYALNSIKAPHNSVANELLNGSIGNLISLQLSLVF